MHPGCGGVIRKLQALAYGLLFLPQEAISSIVKCPYEETPRESVTANAFRKTGIWINDEQRPSRFVFTDDEFSPDPNNSPITAEHCGDDGSAGQNVFENNRDDENYDANEDGQDNANKDNYDKRMTMTMTIKTSLTMPIKTYLTMTINRYDHKFRLYGSDISDDETPPQNYADHSKAKKTALLNKPLVSYSIMRKIEQQRKSSFTKAYIAERHHSSRSLSVSCLSLEDDPGPLKKEAKSTWNFSTCYFK
ncbi:unnamed protein product [Allacma fusca]|uniref:Uncharacterized protein n=1 Tax=Allacma fusca TaxID=39272 RepID=A0A8J2KFF5_9HEXA|nr:unnamed protein product [Allacma fusca]